MSSRQRRTLVPQKGDLRSETGTPPGRDRQDMRRSEVVHAGPSSLVGLTGGPSVQPSAATARCSRRLTALSEREREVLGYIARGFTNSEIAAELVLSGATVKSHVAHLLRKTDSRDRVRLVILAFESGLAQATASLGDTSESAA